MKVSGVALTVTLGLSAIACHSGAVSSTDASSRDCTLVGCQDMFTAAISMSGSTLKAGIHTLETDSDGTMRTCTVNITQPFLDGMNSGTDVGAVSCDDGIRVYLTTETTCTSTTSADGGVTSTGCVPIPGRFIERISIAGLPTNVRVRQLLNGVAIFDESQSVTYTANRPNGPTCEPECRAGGFELTFP